MTNIIFWSKWPELCSERNVPKLTISVHFFFTRFYFDWFSIYSKIHVCDLSMLILWTRLDLARIYLDNQSKASDHLRMHYQYGLIRLTVRSFADLGKDFCFFMDEMDFFHINHGKAFRKWLILMRASIDIGHDNYLSFLIFEA